MSARIEKLLGIASLQGPPVLGYRRYGVPPGGAFDQESFRIANAMLGNDPSALTIELSNASIEIQFSKATRIAIVGAPVQIEVGELSAPPDAAFDIPKGNPLKIFAARDGFRSYVAVAGGWLPDGIDSLLGRSGKRLNPGDVLEHAEVAPSGVVGRLANPPLSLAPAPFRILAGSQPIASITQEPLHISNSSDRTGIRMDGLPPREIQELTSEPACVGTVQLTPSGQIIVFGPDGPTIAGYPKVAVVCSADLDRLAHLRPRQEVTFEEIDLATAHELAAERETRLSRILSQLAVAAASQR